MRSISLSISAMMLFIAIESLGQSVSYSGLGRMYIVDDYLNGNLVEGDSVSATSGTSGHILFDLGIEIHPSKAINASAVLRSKTEFGGFFGDGASFEFRQFNINGILGNKGPEIAYEIGDLDLSLSQYTLFNETESFNDYESAVFALRRSIVDYENFNYGNNWRLQGVRLATKIDIEKVISHANIEAFGTRSKNSLNFQYPDRFLIGGKAEFVHSDLLSLGINLTRFSDEDNTTSNTLESYNINVITGAISGSLEIADDKSFSYNIESGQSSFNGEDLSLESSTSVSDAFLDAQAAFDLKTQNISISVGYKRVGHKFSSPGAQTRRIYDNGTPVIFSQVQEATAYRSISAFDRYSQYQMYNMSISPTLMSYDPRYNLINPYGAATPNRTGLTIGFSSIDEKKWYQYEVNASMLSEIIGEGMEAKRSFTGLYAGGKAALGTLLEYSRDLNLIFGLRLEKSSREDVLVDYTNLGVDAGIEFEVVPNLYLQGGLKQINSSGTEVLAVRDNFNNISSFQLINASNTNANIKENISSAGIKWKLGNYSAFHFAFQKLVWNNSDNEDENYDISEFFVGYTLKF